MHCKANFLVYLHWNKKYSDSDSEKTISPCGCFQKLAAFLLSQNDALQVVQRLHQLGRLAGCHGAKQTVRGGLGNSLQTLLDGFLKVKVKCQLKMKDSSETQTVINHSIHQYIFTATSQAKYTSQAKCTCTWNEMRHSVVSIHDCTHIHNTINWLTAYML